MGNLPPIIKYHGGKGRLSKWIISHFPEHKYFIDGCGGGGSIILNKKPAWDFYNEPNLDIYYIFFYLREDDSFLYDIEQTPYSEENFKHAIRLLESEANFRNRAFYSLIKYRMSRGGLGKDFAWSTRLRRGVPGDINAWENFKKNLPLIRNRLQNISFNNIDILTLEDNLDDIWLVYLDPPYVKSTRTDKNTYGKYDWNDDKHIQLCNKINKMKCNIILSGYDNEIYQENLKSWRLVKREVPNNAGQGKKKQKRVECLWMNY